MADVSVNIRGRDDGAGSMLDSLREKASNIGRELGEVSENFDNLTKTERRVEIERSHTESTNARKESVREEYRDARQANLDEYQGASNDFRNKRINAEEFKKKREQFHESNTNLTSEEEKELNAIEKESNSYLKEILKQLQLQERVEAERRQRDGSEFADGSIGSLLAANSDLRRRQTASTDEDEIAALQSEIASNNRTIRGMRNNGDDDDDDDGGNSRFGRGLGSTGHSVARGDLSGSVTGGLGMLGGTAAGIGIAAMIIKEFVSHGELVKEAIGQTASMRGGIGTSGITANDALVNRIGSFSSQLSDLGLKQENFASMVNQKALASGMAGNDVVARTLDDYRFQKGFGADAGMFSQFERFNQGQQTSTEIAMDVLSVLTSIEKSSLKESDLSTLTEKLQSQNAILSFQRNKRDVVDSDSALRTLAAYETAGLSQKGDKAGDFLNQTMQGLGEGGSDNAMLFKYEAAKRAHPELANDPAALRRMVKFRSDDPKYQAEFFKFAKQASGGSKMAEDDILYTMFNPQSEADMDIYKRMMENKGGSRSALTKTLDKTRKATLGIETMKSDATNDTGTVTMLETAFSNVMTNVFNDFKTWATDFFSFWRKPPVPNPNKTRAGK